MQAYNSGEAVDRRHYTRQPEGARREALIAATLELVAEGGIATATVRAIAERAGVTGGLIRHYFGTKEALVAEAYRGFMAQMTEASAEQAGAQATPIAALSAYLAAALSPPVMDARSVALWAGFLQSLRSDPAMRAVHEQTYLAFRDRLERLIAAALPHLTPRDTRRAAISLNALIDGLWLEGSALPDAFAEGELRHIGLASAGAILSMPLESL